MKVLVELIFTKLTGKYTLESKHSIIVVDLQKSIQKSGIIKWEIGLMRGGASKCTESSAPQKR